MSPNATLAADKFPFGGHRRPVLTLNSPMLKLGISATSLKRTVGTGRFRHKITIGRAA